MSLDQMIQRRLTDPRAPDGEKIAWQHPLLVFFAENGTIAPSEEAERKATEKLLSIVKHEQAPQHMLELFIYQSVSYLDEKQASKGYV